MLKRTLKIGRWVVDFLFAVSEYDEEGVLSVLYDMDAPLETMMRANKIMGLGKNRGFTYANQELRRAAVVIGPASGGKQFQNTVVHELHHLAVAIAKSLGVDLDGEDPAYLSGDSAMEIADIICTLGCRCCNRK